MEFLTAQEHRDILEKRPILRHIYRKWYSMIKREMTRLPNGAVIEIGTGCGILKEFLPEAFISDIQNTPWNDLCMDAQKSPIKSESVSSIIMIDVLHHIPDPLEFFAEAERILAPGGCLVMIEPYPTFFSEMLYKWFHSEPMITTERFFSSPPTFTSPNQAASCILFSREKAAFEKAFPCLSIQKHKLFSTLLYPLSGGYTGNQFIPDFLVPLAEFLEKLMTPFNPIAAFRSFTVIKKGEHHGQP